MTVWIYVDTRKQVGDKDHLKVFADQDAARQWFGEHDREACVRVSGEGLTRTSDPASGPIGLTAADDRRTGSWSRTENTALKRVMDARSHETDAAKAM